MKNDITLFSEINIVNAFEEKLDELIQLKQLGTYILCLANALTDKRLYKVIEPKLHTALAKLKSHRPQATDDDNAVFEKLINPNIAFPKIAQSKQVGNWQVQYNPIRSYRPARNASEKVSSIFKAFEQNAFHFNKPFLQKEKLQSITFKNTPIDCFLNKFPFTQNHLLLLINPKACSPQLLSKATLTLVYQLSLSIKTNEYAYFAYNALGAYASVNHLHVHFTSVGHPLPISNPTWQHNGGQHPYPVNVQCFKNTDDCWQAIDTLHRLNQTYNLIIQGQNLYLIARAFQASVKHEDWVSNIAWFELAGVITVAEPKIYKNLSETMIFNELSKINVSE